MSKSKLKLPYGLKDGKLIHIVDAENGLGCACVCPSCSAPLVARNEGAIRIPHFSHYKKPDCADALETAMHILAKEDISKNKKLYLPSLDLKIGNFSCNFFEGGIFAFDKVETEKKYEGFIPDITCYVDDKPVLFVEITVTHGIDDDKAFEIKQSGISCLEIKLDREKHFEKDTIHNLIMGKYKKEEDSLFEDAPYNDGSFWVYNEFKNIMCQTIHEMSKYLTVSEGDKKKYSDPYFINGCPAEKHSGPYGYYARPYNCELCDYNLDGIKPEEGVFCIGSTIQKQLLDKILQRINTPY